MSGTQPPGANVLTSERFVLGVDAPRITVDPGVARQMLGYSEDLMTCPVWFETGARATPHAHPHAQVTYAKAGRFLFQAGCQARENFLAEQQS